MMAHPACIGVGVLEGRQCPRLEPQFSLEKLGCWRRMNLSGDHWIVLRRFRFSRIWAASHSSSCNFVLRFFLSFVLAPGAIHACRLLAYPFCQPGLNHRIWFRLCNFMYS